MTTQPMTPEQHRAYAAELLTEHARDVEALAIAECAEDSRHVPGDAISQADCDAVYEQIRAANVTITWPGDRLGTDRVALDAIAHLCGAPDGTQSHLVVRLVQDMLTDPARHNARRERAIYLVRRLVDALADQVASTIDPGTEVLGALWEGREFIQVGGAHRPPLPADIDPARLEREIQDALDECDPEDDDPDLAGAALAAVLAHVRQPEVAARPAAEQAEPTTTAVPVEIGVHQLALAELAIQLYAIAHDVDPVLVEAHHEGVPEILAVLEAYEAGFLGDVATVLDRIGPEVLELDGTAPAPSAGADQLPPGGAPESLPELAAGNSDAVMDGFHKVEEAGR